MSQSEQRGPLFVLAATLCVALIAVILFRKHTSLSPQAAKDPQADKQVAASSPASLTNKTVPYSSEVSLRPFAVSRKSDSFEWTAEDGKDTNAIRRLAHNPLEYARMVEENPRILRRQLVYLKETAAAVMENSKVTGEAIKQLTLPGLDGQEIKFNISSADLEPSKLVGTFTGELPNRPNSMVTLAYKFGRESFTVISPDDGIYLQGWPREPGEVIVTSFDPDKYQTMPGGEPILTTNTFKIAQ